MSSQAKAGGSPPPRPSTTSTKRYGKRSRQAHHRRAKPKSFAMTWIDSAAQRAQNLFTSLSMLLELLLTFAHSFYCWLWYVLVLPNKTNKQPEAGRSSSRKAALNSGSSDSAWWDANKGSAIVICDAGSQVMARSLAISLAACRSSPRERKQTRISPSPPRDHAVIRLSEALIATRPGRFLLGILRLFCGFLPDRGTRPDNTARPPFTVIVLVPDPEDLSPLVHDWASKKAELERPKSSPPSPRPMRYAAGVAEPTIDPPSPLSLSTSRPPSPSSKRRTPSWSQWSAATDLVGFRDLWKGLRVGEDDAKTEFGAVIPVVCDMSGPDGLDHVNSTVLSYCTSHNLLLRGLVTISADASPVGTAVTKDRFFSSKSTHFDNSHDALVSSVLNLLQKDKGRLVSLQCPSKYGWAGDAKRQLAPDVTESQVQLYPRYDSKALSADIVDRLHESGPKHGLFGLIKSAIICLIGAFQYLFSPSLLVARDRMNDLNNQPLEVDSSLLYAVRSALLRSHPRSSQCIGLGPRLQLLAEYIPGFQSLKELYKYVIRNTP